MGQNEASDQLLGRFAPFFFAMIFIYQMGIQIGAVVGEIWRIGSEKWGSRRGQLDVCATTSSF
jgi:hypothetical protein